MSTVIDLEGVEHHPAVREITDILCAKIQNSDRGFFHCEVAYFIAKMAATMGAVIKTKDRGEVPVNLYALALATSGFGKGHSVNIMEREFMKPFERRFMEDTMPTLSESNLQKLANDRAARNGSDANQEFDKISGEYGRAGSYPFTFDGGTVPAVKQLRHKLLLANCGAINLQIDEIGANLINSGEVLTVFLELFDQGLTKQKLTKNTNENQRGDEIDGKTPTNMLLFGTPSKLFDGAATEDLFYAMLDMGFARRCIFGHGQQQRRSEDQDPAEVYQQLIKKENIEGINKWAGHFHKLADPAMFGWKMRVEDEVGIRLLTYKMACEREADKLPEHEEIQKAELSHRYFKTLKLAGAFAFIDKASEIELSHLNSAMLLVEESGAAFKVILSREKAYAKLAKYVADINEDVTHADLHEALPFYKSGNAARNELMTLATAWGYKRNIIIKKSFIDGIEFFRGETLEETDLSKIKISYSDNFAYNYLGETVPFEQLHVVTQQPGYHWANHHFKNNHRAEENAFAGFNMVTIDVDGGVRLEAVHELLKEYKFLTYTTKRHTEKEHRFRLILPISHVLELDSDEYKEFMNSIMAWLPFKTDEAANQRSKKWESCDTDLQGEKSQHFYNLEGRLLDSLDFIPKTSRHEAFQQGMRKLESYDNLERWFAQRMVEGNRNNHMIKFALALVDSGMDLLEVTNAVKSFNSKINNPLTENELQSTVMVTVGKRYLPN